MKTKKVTRYYCDHCGKGGFKKPSMIDHEMSCTMNPKRSCSMCEHALLNKDIPTLAAELLKRDDVEWGEDLNENGVWSTKSQAAIDWISSQTGNCPLCILAVLRQAKVFAFDVFDYKKRRDEYRLEELNAQNRRYSFDQ